jgi:hypothetical protein
MHILLRLGLSSNFGHGLGDVECLRQPPADPGTSAEPERRPLPTPSSLEDVRADLQAAGDGPGDADALSRGDLRRPGQVQTDRGKDLVLDAHAEARAGGHVRDDMDRQLGGEEALELLLPEIGADASRQGDVDARSTKARPRPDRPLVSREAQRKGQQRLEQGAPAFLGLAAGLDLPLEVDAGAEEEAQRAAMVPALRLLRVQRTCAEQEETEAEGPARSQEWAPGEDRPALSLSRPERNGSRSSAT